MFFNTFIESSIVSGPISSNILSTPLGHILSISFLRFSSSIIP
ncbi:MAG: hypothetical protein ACI4RQ_06380 [Methanobrevibacter wolinii]